MHTDQLLKGLFIMVDGRWTQVTTAMLMQLSNEQLLGIYAGLRKSLEVKSTSK